MAKQIQQKTPFLLAVLIGIIPAVLAAALQWYLDVGTDPEIRGGYAYLVPILGAWWAGVSAGVMTASTRARTLKAGFVVGALSVLPFAYISVLARKTADPMGALLSPEVWITAILAMAIPTGIGVLFAEKQLKRSV